MWARSGRGLRSGDALRRRLFACVCEDDAIQVDGGCQPCAADEIPVAGVCACPAGEAKDSTGVCAAVPGLVGGYVLAGYRLDRWWQIMPFVMIEIDRPRIDPDAGDVEAYLQVVGVNLRPLPNVTLKVQYAAAEVTHSPILSGVLQIVAAQAAWAF